MLDWFWLKAFCGLRSSRLFAGCIPALAYHKIGPAPQSSRDPFLYASPGEFSRQLELLRRTGFQPARLDRLASPAGFRDQNVVVTFDDAFVNVLENGLDILARHRMTAIQFVVAERLGGWNDWDVAKGDTAERLMDAGQLKEWLAAGHEIGSHSATHRNLKRLSPAEAREEISGSKKKLEDLFGIEVKHFAYPYGGWTPAVRDLVAGAGYHTASTMRWGFNRAGTDRFALRRFIPYSSRDLLRKVAHRLARKIRRPA